MAAAVLRTCTAIKRTPKAVPTAAPMATLIDDELEKWGTVIRTANLRVE